MAMQSDRECRTHFETFAKCVPELGKALKRAYPKPKLTKQELKILNFLSLGNKRKEIAEHLGITTYGIRFHIQAIKKKLHAPNTENALRKAIITGLIVL